MRAVVLRAPRKLEMVDVPKPKLAEDEVLIRVGAVGVCGSDVRYYLGENPWALHTLGLDLKEEKEFILGHEVSGDIIEEGANVSKSRHGERVGVIAFKGCGKCYYCRRNMPNLCAATLHIGHDGGWKDIEYPPGGYADFMQIWADKAQPIPDNVTYEEATQLDGLAVAIHANSRGSISHGDSVMIIGCGAIGLMLLQVARARGAANVICVDTWEFPLKLAERLGADHVLNPKETGNLSHEAVELTGGTGLNVVFDTVGEEQTVGTGLRSLARSGRYVTLAVTTAKMQLALTDVGGEKTITCSANNLYEDYPTAVELLASGKVKVKPFITHSMKLQDYALAFDMLLNKEAHNAVKIVLIP